MAASSEHAEVLERDGFVVIQDFFSREEVERARAEVAALANPSHKGPYEYLINIYGKCPTVDSMVERILSDSATARLLEALAGPHIKLRGYNVRRMTGEYDPSDNLNPAMDWHRDAPGEFCLSIFLDPLDAENGATAAIPGSHKLPYDPRWNCMFGSPFIWLDEQGKIHSGLPVFKHLNWLSRALAGRVRETATSIVGKPGDFYIFINDIWHGRSPNLHGRKGMVVMIGAFATDAPYPDSVSPPSPAVLEKLPPRLRAAAAQTNPVQHGQDSIVHRLVEYRRSVRPTGLFLLARWERKFAEAATRGWLGFVALMRGLWALMPIPVSTKNFIRGILRTPPRVHLDKLWGVMPSFVKNVIRRLAGRPQKNT